MEVRETTLSAGTTSLLSSTCRAELQAIIEATTH